MRPVAKPDSSLRHPLTAILGTEANVRILRELFLHGGQLSAPRLAMRTGVSEQHVRLALARLIKLGVVWVLGSGRSHLYGFAPDHALAAELLELFRAEAANFARIIEELRKTAETFADAFVAVWLYGSVARGDDRPESDLDLVVVTRDSEVAAIDAFRAAITDAGRRLGFRSSVVRLTDPELRRLSAEKDPWWITLTRDWWPIFGVAPVEFEASRAGQRATLRRTA